MKHCYISFLVLIALLLSACKQQSNSTVIYPLQEDRALVGVPNDRGEMAYMIINADKKVVSYIHLSDIKLDTIYREGKLAFTHIKTGQRGYYDLDGHEVWISPETTETETPTQKFETKSKGKKTSVTMNTNDWQKVITQSSFYEEAKKTFTGGLDVTDVANRQMILDYVEQLRKSYTTKDISFIEQVFSDHALIITGKVIRESSTNDNQYLPQEQVVYNIRSKKQYLDKLRQIFAANHRINLLFTDFKINRHPTIPTVYGVSFRQTYSSDLYSDDGYLFLLWDFKDAEAPQIYVRTWQPRILDDQTVIPENQIFSLRNFNLK